MAAIVLDLFCGGGGAGEGYRRAGFHVIGIDIADHSKSFSHVGEFHQMGWDEGLAKFGDKAAFIHASPPCQDYSALTAWGRPENLARGERFGAADLAVVEAGTDSKHPQLIAPVRAALEGTGKPFVIENVTGAEGRLRTGYKLMLCGWMFKYEVYRHRHFEQGGGMSFRCPQHPSHPLRSASPGHFKEGQFMGIGGHFAPVPLGREVMDARWMTVDEVSESIPPYFTHYLGNQVREHLGLPVLHDCPLTREPGPEARRLIWDHVPPEPEQLGLF